MKGLCSSEAENLYHTLEYHDSIRVFRLSESEKDTDPLQGELVTTRRSDKPKYRALSYMWGPKDLKTEVPLLVNGHVLQLRANIASALHAYREHRRHLRVDKDLPLWIDLICIQQNDVEEKNHQVQQMGAIYSQAHSVLIWLGRATRVLLFKYFVGSATSTANLSGQTVTPPQNLTELRALFWSLLNHHWTRTWILQEVCLAQRVAIFTEKSLFRSKVFEQLRTQNGFLNEMQPDYWTSSEENKNPYATAMKLFRRFEMIWKVRESRRDPRWRPLSLSSTIHQLAVESECLEHRDKVFAILDMSSTSEKMKIDYARDESEIFWDVLKSTPMKEIDYHEVSSLLEVLKLTWRRVLLSTKRRLANDETLHQSLLPCTLDGGVLSLKRDRAFQSQRACRRNTFRMNCWFRKGLDSSQIMLQIQLQQSSPDTYIIKDAKYCPDEQQARLLSGLDLTDCRIRILDQEWANRRETVAVDPLFYVTLRFLADLSQNIVVEDLNDMFPSIVVIEDKFFRQRKATKRFGMPIDERTKV